MKQFTLILLLFIIATGCSKDDSDTGPQPIAADEKLLNSVDDFILLQYNPDKTVKKLTIAASIQLRYSYENGRISEVAVINDGEVDTYLFSYDANNRISSYSLDDEVTQVNYNVANKYYLAVKENGDELGVFFDDEGNIKKFQEYDNQQNETETTSIFYVDGPYKGTFANTNDIALHTVLVSPELLQIFYGYNLTKTPVETLVLPEFVIDFINTYDDQGFLSSSSYEFGPQNTTFHFTYTSL